MKLIIEIDCSKGALNNHEGELYYMLEDILQRIDVAKVASLYNGHNFIYDANGCVVGYIRMNENPIDKQPKP